MTSEQIRRIAERIVIMNSMCGVNMPDNAVMYQAKLLADLDFDLVVKAFDNYALSNKTGRPPTVAHIREIINPVVSERDLANELARKIDKCVAKHGWSWSEGQIIAGDDVLETMTMYEGASGKLHDTFKEAVISEIGEVGWHVICSRGGWSNVRNSANEMPEGMFISQMRDQVESTLRLQKAGVDVAKIGLPEPHKLMVSDGERKLIDIMKK